MELVVIKVTSAALRNSPTGVAGVSGRVYYPNPDTGVLYGRKDRQGPPGVHVECAKRLLRFAWYELVRSRPPARRKKAPASDAPAPSDVAPDTPPVEGAGASDALSALLESANGPSEPEEPAVDPQEARKAELLDLPRKNMNAIAKGHGLKGYTKVEPEELADQIVAVEFPESE